jgi:two-component system, OmpR family, response regulator
MQTRLNVLVVDDDDVVREMIATILRRGGMNPECVADGDSAFRQLRCGSFDAVILDLMLPRINGFEILREIKNSFPELLPRVVVVTAASEQTLRDFDTTGIRKLLRKPFDIDELVREVFDCADGKLFGVA